MSRSIKYLLTVLLLYIFVLVLATPQDNVTLDSIVQKNDTIKTETDTVSENPKYVYLLNADEILYSKRLHPDAQLLIGNIVFRHDSMYMYCDSALFYQNANSFKAYSNVRVEQGDTLFLYGDSLFYDGDAKIARVRDNVRLENTSMTLLTDSLNYDRNLDLGYFFDGGTLLDEDNTLTADYGQYHTVSKLASFYHKVKLETPDYILTSDTLLYNTDLHKAYIVSPSKIVSDDNTITTSRGQFDTNSKSAILLDRSVLEQNDGLKNVVGDSITYDDANGVVEAFGKVEIRNLEDKIDADGEYFYLNQQNDSAVVTGDALVIEYSTSDSLFLHADTLRLVSFYNSTRDTVLYRHIRAFNKVKAYRKDMQMIADSLEFNSLDSCLTLYKDPIIWSDNQQLLGVVIKVYMNDSTIDWVHVIDHTLFVQMKDSVHYNQISGREMKAYFANGNIERADVNGNVLVIYYPEDDDKEMIGMNTTQAAFLSAYFVNREVNKLVIKQNSNGVMYPMEQLITNKMYLSDFNWFDRLRPFSRYDIFYWRGKLTSEKLKESSHKEVPLPTLK